MSAARTLPTSNTDAVSRGAIDVSVMLSPEFRLQSGEKLARGKIALRIYGDRSKPAIVAAGGISAGRKVADNGEEKGWWRDFVGRDCAVDLDRFCVIGFDFLPNLGETARTISSRDQARALAFALLKIDVPRLHAFVGASYGGMVALAFAQEFPERLDRLCVVSAADRPHPSATALRGVQRRIIDFARRAGRAGEGVSLARQIAMATYRTPEEFAARFDDTPGAAAGDPYPVCEYLISRGNAYDMSAERYLTLSDSIDRHKIDPARILAPALFIASSSDRLVPAADIERLASGAKFGVLRIVNSLFGHDAFLKEAASIGPIIKTFIEERAP
ncbi:MAG: homoserine O-succinyltransferase [Parvularculaceae bacterium]|nr:homoserine O-succinyltransferase [Parvularculaceae bacterium]